MSYKIKEIPEEERPREKLKKRGVHYLSNAELLAIILKTGTKEKNVNELALDILKRYDLVQMKELYVNNLTAIKGIGEVKAIEVLAAIELGKRIYNSKKSNKIVLNNAKAIWSYSKELFYNKKQELFICLYLNTKNILIDKKLLFMGTLNQSTIHIREIFKEAYRLSASSIICLHNHPSGDITPSKEDILFTQRVMQVGFIQGIPIIDHVIIGEDTFYSFYDHKDILNL